MLFPKALYASFFIVVGLGFAVMTQTYSISWHPASDDAAQT
jgi:hypothetical protein